MTHVIMTWAAGTILFNHARAFSDLTESFWDSHGIEFLIQGVGW